jgi:hypothetical protein
VLDDRSVNVDDVERASDNQRPRRVRRHRRSWRPGSPSHQLPPDVGGHRLAERSDPNLSARPNPSNRSHHLALTVLFCRPRSIHRRCPEARVVAGLKRSRCTSPDARRSHSTDGLTMHNSRAKRPVPRSHDHPRTGARRGRANRVSGSGPGLGTTASEPATIETFNIVTEPAETGSPRGARRLTAEGDLTQLGGELAFAAVISLLEGGVRDMTMDLSQLTAVEDAGLRWLRRACSRTEAIGGRLKTVGVADAYRGLIPTSPGHEAEGAVDPEHALDAASAGTNSRGDISR